VSKRVAVSCEVYNACISNLPVNAFYPTIGELFRLPFALDVVDNLPAPGDITKEDLKPISLLFGDLSIQWKSDKEIQLLDLIAQVYDSQGLPSPETTFDLAMTFFYCSHCLRIIRYPKVLMHSCTRAFRHLANSEADLLKNLHSNKVLWNSILTVQPAHLELVTGLLCMTGLDPRATKVHEMDMLDRIFECVPCNDICEGRVTMSWKTTVIPILLLDVLPH
jgi:hypothetical protein